MSIQRQQVYLSSGRFEQSNLRTIWRELPIPIFVVGGKIEAGEFVSAALPGLQERENNLFVICAGPAITQRVECLAQLTP